MIASLFRSPCRGADGVRAQRVVRAMGCCGLALLYSFSLPIPQCAAEAPAPSQSFYLDCSSSLPGDGSYEHPWNNLVSAQAHPFTPGSRIALKRGTVCRGNFSPQGSGSEARPIRLTSYGLGSRPRIVAGARDLAALKLFNQEYWQIDSLDVAGGNTYGIFISGDRGTLHHIYLKNLFVHDVQGGPFKNKDNGLVVIGPSGPDVIFQDVLVDGVVAAHTNQWAGILIGGGTFPYKSDAPLNSHVTVRNSSVQDVYGDGIVLFRDSDGLIETSVAWQTGMQPTEDVGTPNAIWTWTCTDCTVQDNEAFLTDSPGVDGGAFDIDWNNTRNIVQRNYAHDTQGYCFAVFAAGYVTSESVVRDNLCIDNGLSPRLQALQGIVYLLTWNGGVIRGLIIEHNTIRWNPRIASAAALVNGAKIEGGPVTFAGNLIESSGPNFYRSNSQFAPASNTYRYWGPGGPRFTLGNLRDANLEALQSLGLEKGSHSERTAAPAFSNEALHMDATLDFAVDSDGLLVPGARAQWTVLRSLAAQYGASALAVTIHLRTIAGSPNRKAELANALLDMDAASMRVDQDGTQGGLLRMTTATGNLLAEWHGFQNAATLGEAVRDRIGPPRFAQM